MASRFVITVVHYTEGNRTGTVFAETWEDACMKRDRFLSTWACDVHISAIIHTTYTARNSTGTRMYFKKDNKHLIEMCR